MLERLSTLDTALGYTRGELEYVKSCKDERIVKIVEKITGAVGENLLKDAVVV